MSIKLDVCIFRKIYLEKYNETLEKLSNIIKIIKENLIVNLCIMKKFLKAEKKINAKEGFQSNID